MTKILAPLSVQIVAHDVTRVLERNTRDEFFVDAVHGKKVSCTYDVRGEVTHEVFVDVKEDATCAMNFLYRAHEKDTKMRVRISVLLRRGAKISFDVASFCDGVAQQTDVRVFVVFNEETHATMRVFTSVVGSQSVVHEEIRGLMLGESASTSFIPELSLLHDDVVATHATSVTKVDEKHVVYLRSRGILREDAVQQIAHAFLWKSI